MKKPLDPGRMAAVIMMDGMPSITAGFRSAEANALKFGKVLKVSRDAGKFGFRDCIAPEKAAEELRKMPAGTVCVMPRSRRLTYDVLFDMPEPVDGPVFERKYESCGTILKTVEDCIKDMLGDSSHAVPGMAAVEEPLLRVERDMRAPATVVVNDLQYPGRLGNLLMLILQTHMAAADMGVHPDDVFFKRHVDTYDGWANSFGNFGRRLDDYIVENKDILVPIWGNMLSDAGFRQVCSRPGVVSVGHSISTPKIRGFMKEIANPKYTGLASSLFYDESTFGRRMDMFRPYFEPDTVALHVRRTDFQFIKDVVHRQPHQIQQIVDGCRDSTVVVFSDDIGWCRDTLSPPRGGRLVFHLPSDVPCDDLILMSCFRTILQSAETSTYSMLAKILSRDLFATGRMQWQTAGAA